MSITFNGLASGLDTGSLITQLVSIERSSATALSTRQSDLNTQKSIVGSLSSALSTLGTAARGMDLDSEIRPRAVTLSDSGKISVAVSANATAAVHDLRVKQLAAAQITSSRVFDTATAGTLASGGVDITVGSATKSVTWDSTDTLDSIATKINDAGAGVSASVLFDGTKHRLVVTASDTGLTARPTFVDHGDGLDLANAANIKVPAADSIVSIDGIDVTRSKNVVSDALAGVTLTLNAVHAVADPATKATVSLDQKALTDKVKAMVTAYNSVNSALHVQLDYNGTTKGSNTLFGDSALRQLQGSLASTMSREYGGSNLSVLGLSRDKTGALTFDESKLATALAADPQALSKVFVGGGFATAMTSMVDAYTESGTGILASKSQSLADRHKALQSQIDRINKNADSLQTRLEKQFAALEQAMSAFQSQSSYLAAIFK
ncbi:MAG: flagellar filament capping protein FliD [Myxococcales bacterium]|nr:flagellar filament capping protein FliD [Myxococcales bacterium]